MVQVREQQAEILATSLNIISWEYPLLLMKFYFTSVAGAKEVCTINQCRRPYKVHSPYIHIVYNMD